MKTKSGQHLSNKPFIGFGCIVFVLVQSTLPWWVCAAITVAVALGLYAMYRHVTKDPDDHNRNEPPHPNAFRPIPQERHVEPQGHSGTEY